MQKVQAYHVQSGPFDDAEPRGRIIRGHINAEVTSTH